MTCLHASGQLAAVVRRPCRSVRSPLSRCCVTSFVRPRSSLGAIAALSSQSVWRPPEVRNSIRQVHCQVPDIFPRINKPKKWSFYHTEHVGHVIATPAATPRELPAERKAIKSLKNTDSTPIDVCIEDFMPFGHVRHPYNTYLATFRLLGAAAGQLLDRPPHRARGDAESLRAFQTGKWGRLHRWGVGRPRPDGLLTSRPSTSRSAVRLASPV